MNGDTSFPKKLGDWIPGKDYYTDDFTICKGVNVDGELEGIVYCNGNNSREEFTYVDGVRQGKSNYYYSAKY